MSEGSSDNEGNEDDLSPAQANYLIQMIKGGKCGSVSRCKMRLKSKVTRKTTEDIKIEISELAEEPTVPPQP